MPLTLTWQEIALRLALSVVAGTLIGLDRGEHGRPAGLRTTLLVCLAAAVAMIQANLLLATTGKTSDSFISLDLMRLPLGILTYESFRGQLGTPRRAMSNRRHTVWARFLRKARWDADKLWEVADEWTQRTGIPFSGGRAP